MLKQNVNLYDLHKAVELTTTDLLTRAFRNKVTIRVDVTYNGGDTASTSWRWYGAPITVKGVNNPNVCRVLDVIINLPSYPATRELSRNEADHIIGYILHEIGHNLFTDDQLLSRRPELRQIFGTINALEDIRIERETIKLGLASNAQQCLERLARRVVASAEHDLAKDSGKASLVGVACFAGREHVNGYDLGNVIGRLGKHLEQGDVAILHEIFSRVAVAQSTNDIADIAEWLHGKQQQQQGNQDQQQSQPQQQGDQAQGDQSQKVDQDQGDQDQEGQEQDGNGQDDQDENGQDQANQAQGTASAQLGEDTELTNSHDRNNDVNLSRDQIGQSPPPFQPADHCRVDHLRGLVNATRVHDGQKARGKRLGQVKTPPAAMLERDLASMLRAPKKTRVDRYQDRGRLHRRDVARIAAGQVNVFYRCETQPAVNTAVSIVLDQSSSMARVIDNAAGAALMIAKVCERVGAPIEINGFHSNSMFNYKPFDRRLANCQSHRFFTSAGATPLSPILMKSVIRLDQKPGKETRKLLLVLCDGECGYLNTIGYGTVKWIERYAASRGIAVAGLGIGCDISHMFTHHQTVYSLADLGRSGLGMLRSMMGDASHRQAA